MGPLCSGEKRNNRARWISARGQDDLDREALISQELHASPTMPSAERVSPQQGSRSDRERMQEHTHLTRLRGCIAQPLTLLAQGAGTATTDTGSVDHTQAPIGFPTPLVSGQLLPGGTAQRAIWLKGKVATREATRLPGRGDLGGSIALHRRNQVGSRSLPSEVSRSKLGGAYGIREQVMAQLQPQVPGPLADNLPAFLAPGGMTAPTIRILLTIFIGKCVFKRTAMQIERHHISSSEGFLWQGGQEQLIDDPIALDAHPRLFQSCRMSRHHDATALSIGPHSHLWAVIERPDVCTFRTAELLIGRKGKPKLDLGSQQHLIVFAAHDKRQSRPGSERVAPMPYSPSSLTSTRSAGS